jgi:PAS domain S-box-containing protein
MVSVSEGLSGASAASLVRERKVRIIHAWHQRVLREVSAAGWQDRAALIDSLPEFLEHLARTLEAPAPQALEASSARVAETHGEERSEQPEYNLSQVLYEYQVLREVLVDILEQPRRFAPEAQRLLHAFIDQGLRVAASRFVERSMDLLGRAEQSAQLKERELEQLFASAAGPMVFFSGPDFVYERVNAHYLELFQDRDIVGKPVMQAVPELAHSEFPAILRSVFETGKPVFIPEGRVDLKDRRTGAVRPRYFDASYSRIEVRDGSPVGIFHSAVEVTERVLIREEALRTAQALRISEQRLAQALSVTGAGIWEVDLSTQEVLADARFREMFGLTQDEPFSLAKGLAIIHPEDSPTVAAAVAAAIAGQKGGLYDADYRTVPQPDGSYRWVAARGQAYVDAQGQAVRFVGTGIDITARKELEAARSSLLASIADQSLFGVAVLRGPELRFTLANAGYRAIVGHRDVLGKAMLEALPELAGQGADTQLLEIMRTGKPVMGHEIQYWVDAQGTGQPEPRFYNFAWQPIHPVHGPVDSVLALTHDVTDAVRAREREAELARESQARAEFEQYLIGIVSHDLRNPLSVIQMGATLLSRREELDARSLKSVVRIQASAERALRMVKDLLDFTQVRVGGGFHLVLQPVDLHELVRTTVDEVETAYESREVRLLSQGDGWGTWDAGRLGQLAQNLVTNALKYSPDGTAVEVETRAEGDTVTLTVRNQGTPIPPAQLSRLFQPMQRGLEAGDRESRSVGLGLYIVKAIVEAHQGHVAVTSTAETGTAFTVRLPRTVLPPAP